MAEPHPTTAASVLRRLRDLESSPQELIEFLHSVVSGSGYAHLAPGLKDHDIREFIDILDRVSAHEIRVLIIVNADVTVGYELEPCRQSVPRQGSPRAQKAVWTKRTPSDIVYIDKTAI
jgi:hypothetical protein